MVAVLGGSVASYFAVNGTRRLEADLAGSPRFADQHFVFVNLALGGYKEPQQLMTMAYLMTLGAQFDLVLNIDGFNEVALHELENAGHHIFPAFPRSWYAKVGSTDPALGLIRGKLLVLDEATSPAGTRALPGGTRCSATSSGLSATTGSSGRPIGSAKSTSRPTIALGRTSSPGHRRNSPVARRSMNTWPRSG